VVVGYGAEQVQSVLPAGVRSVVQEPQLGTGHAAHCGVEAAASQIGRDPSSQRDAHVLVVNGDLPLLESATLKALLERHLETQADLTVLTCVKTDPTGYGRIIRTDRGEVRDIIEEPDCDETTRRLREVNVGTYVFRASAFREFYAKTESDNAQGEYYLTDVVVVAAQGGARVATVTVGDETEVAQVNSRSELARATEILRGRLLERYMSQGVTILDPLTTYVEKGVRIGRDSVILPFTMIERDVEIGERCEIGPFSHLRPGTRLSDGASIGNFVEIKNSKVGEETKVRHLSYVGDGILGADVNIGAGTIFANYDGKTKSTTVVGDGAFVGSGTVLVAPVSIGRRAITGAGSVVLKNRDVPDDGLAVGVPARLIPRKETAT